MQYTNQANKPSDTAAQASPSAMNVDSQPSYSDGPASANVSTVHEYRVDWVPSKTMFFLDGVLQQTFTTNVPTKAGPW